MSPTPKISRRAVTLAGLGVAAAAAIGGIVLEAPRLLRRRARGQYADLVNRLNDPDQAAVVGRALQSHAVPAKEDLDALRAALAKKPFTDVIAADAAEGNLLEADGWILPATLAALCILAAQSA